MVMKTVQRQSNILWVSGFIFWKNFSWGRSKTQQQIFLTWFQSSRLIFLMEEKITKDYQEKFTKSRWDHKKGQYARPYRQHTTLKNSRSMKVESMKFILRAKVLDFKGIFKLWSYEQQDNSNAHHFWQSKFSYFMR